MFKTKSLRNITFYGNEYESDIKCISECGIKSIDELFGKLLDIWCKDTCYPLCKDEYDYENDPSYGQCAITAMIVCDLFGGTIHKIRVEGGGTHYFNKINGHFIDLTSDQFELYDIPIVYDVNEEVPREICGKNEDTLRRYELLKEKLGL